MNCRFCNTLLKEVFLDLYNSPPSNSFLTKDELEFPEIYYPLKVFVCDSCFLVQIPEYKKSEKIFNENYIYFSSFSKTWLDHCKEYTDNIIERLNLDKSSFVMEIASNDGYLLQFFKERDIRCIGVEPTANTANVAIKKGIDVIVDFFSSKFVTDYLKENDKADLIIANNVLAHVPDLNDFVRGMKLCLSKNGSITIEVPYLLNLINENQFDTIYHEHYSYFSVFSLKSIFEYHELSIYHIEKIKTHGGSLRLFIKHLENNSIKIQNTFSEIYGKELEQNINRLDIYRSFICKVNKVKLSFLSFLVKCKKEKKKVIGYGAAAKGNTLLNFCGIRNDLIDFLVDISPYKQNKYLPGSHIPVVGESKIIEQNPDYIIIFPWNIKEEIIEQLSYTRKWNCKFVTIIPEINIQ